MDPSSDLNTLVKCRGILFGIYFISVFLYTVIPIKIKSYKQNWVHEVQNNLDDKDLLLDMTVNFIRLCSLLIGIALSLIVSKNSLFEFDKFSNTLMIFSLNVLFPPFFIFIVCFSHYYRHQDLRTTIISLIYNIMPAKSTMRMWGSWPSSRWSRGTWHQWRRAHENNPGKTFVLIDRILRPKLDWYDGTLDTVRKEIKDILQSLDLNNLSRSDVIFRAFQHFDPDQVHLTAASGKIFV